MGQQIVRQPNGYYAIWSSNSDTIVGWNLTPEDIIGYRVERAKNEAEKEVRETVEQLEKGGKPYYQFTKSWDDCVRGHQVGNGDGGRKGFERIKKEATEPFKPDTSRVSDLLGKLRSLIVNHGDETIEGASIVGETIHISFFDQPALILSIGKEE